MAAARPFGPLELLSPGEALSPELAQEARAAREMARSRAPRDPFCAMGAFEIAARLAERSACDAWGLAAPGMPARAAKLGEGLRAWAAFPPFAAEGFVGIAEEGAPMRRATLGELAELLLGLPGALARQAARAEAELIAESARQPGPAEAPRGRL